ncbi:hypothetical protein [Marinobacterium sedimentorum]|uniref:hypothetical protein n=1 Tax=Marinobacterium sedimentorum TaxID=2927804 RepID=UPI0020C70739|nr:hypothetical protein [Marinobacterium sedimentorum]MCP8690108.1 hypothetical protein [Marinobacterium sedimentorum]
MSESVTVAVLGFEQLMHACSPDRPSIDSRRSTTLLHLTFLLLLAGFVTLWPKSPVAEIVSAASWQALESADSRADVTDPRLVIANGAGDDDPGPAISASMPVTTALQYSPAGPVVGWQVAPCSFEHARAPPTVA